MISLSEIPNTDDTHNIVAVIGTTLYTAKLNIDDLTLSSIHSYSLSGSYKALVANPVYKDIFAVKMLTTSGNYNNGTTQILDMEANTCELKGGVDVSPSSNSPGYYLQWDDTGERLITLSTHGSGSILNFYNNDFVSYKTVNISNSSSTPVGFLPEDKVFWNGGIYSIDYTNNTSTLLNEVTLESNVYRATILYFNGVVLVPTRDGVYYGVDEYIFDSSSNTLIYSNTLVSNQIMQLTLLKDDNTIAVYQQASVWVYKGARGPLRSLTRDTQTFVDTSDANATSNDILYTNEAPSTKTAYVNGQKVTGSVGYIGDWASEIDSITLRDEDQRILMPTRPIYSSGEPDERRYIDVNSIITADTRYSTMANVIGLTPDKIKQGNTILGVQGTVVELNGETKTVTPTTQEQIIVPTGVDKNALTQVTVEAVDDTIDSNIQAGNIKQGITILGVAGTYNPYQIRQYSSETAMNNDIANISEGEVVKVVPNGVYTTYTMNNGSIVTFTNMPDTLEKSYMFFDASGTSPYVKYILLSWNSDLSDLIYFRNGSLYQFNLCTKGGTQLYDGLLIYVYNDQNEWGVNPRKWWKLF